MPLGGSGTTWKLTYRHIIKLLWWISQQTAADFHIQHTWSNISILLELCLWPPYGPVKWLYCVLLLSQGKIWFQLNIFGRSWMAVLLNVFCCHCKAVHSQSYFCCNCHRATLSLNKRWLQMFPAAVVITKKWKQLDKKVTTVILRKKNNNRTSLFPPTFQAHCFGGEIWKKTHRQNKGDYYKHKKAKIIPTFAATNIWIMRFLTQ